MKNLITLILLYVVNFTALAQFSGPGSGTETYPYLITSPSQLNEMRNDLSAHYKLVSNIEIGEWIKSNLGSNGWIPIGTEGLPFTGTFDGNDYSITNLNCSRQNNVGLFGVTSNAQIKNLNLSLTNMTGIDNVGSLIGCSHGTEVSNIRVTGRSHGSNCVGGLIGKIHDNCTTVGASYGEISKLTSVDNCDVECDVNGENNIGGLIGEIYVSTECIMDTKIAREEKKPYNGYWYMHCKIQKDIINSKFNGNISGLNNIGGIIGYVNLDSHTYNSCTFTPTQVSYTYHYLCEAVSKVNIDNCVNLVNNINGENNLGGIVGGSNGKKLKEVGTIYNHGYDAGPGPSNILSINNCSSNADINNCKDYIGGIVGYGHPSVIGLIKNCSAGSNISGENYIGGVIGCGAFDVEECSANGNLNALSYIGGIVGDGGNNILHCYYSGDIINQGNYTGGICGNICKSIKQCIVSSNRISGVKYIGRISGGNNETLNNFANVMCDVRSNGYSIEVSDDEYNGYGVATDNLRSKAFYQGLSWDMETVWDILPGVSLPYHRFQTYPPVISNIVNSESLYFNGTCSDNGQLYVKSNNTTSVYEIAQNNWQFNTNPTKHVCLYSFNTSKHPSIPVCKDIQIAASDISLSETHFNIGVGQSKELIPNIKPLNADVNIVWETSDANIAVVNTNGIITGLNNGTCTIICRDKISGLYAQCTVNVIINVESITVSPRELDMELNSTFELHAAILPENATDKSIKWTSINSDVAYVDDFGVVQAVDYGSTYVVVQSIDGLVSDMCKINVVKHVESVVITEKEVYMNEGETYKLIAEIYPNDATNKTILWSSSNPTIASVSDGLIFARNKGNSIITAKAVDGNYSDICLVLINHAAGLADIEADNTYKYLIYSIDGKQIYSSSCNDRSLSETINYLESGVYIIISLENDGTRTSYKITK